MVFCQEYQTDEGLKEILLKIKEMPYYPPYTGDAEYWELVKKGLIIIPDLISLMDDTTLTEAVVPNFGGNYSIADKAYSVICDIIDGIPTLDFIPTEKNEFNKLGFYIYWNYVRESIDNRIKFQNSFKDWYQLNKNNMVWTKDNEVVHNGKNNSPKTHPAGGYYRVLK